MSDQAKEAKDDQKYDRRIVNRSLSVVTSSLPNHCISHSNNEHNRIAAARITPLSSAQQTTGGPIHSAPVVSQLPIQGILVTPSSAGQVQSFFPPSVLWSPAATSNSNRYIPILPKTPIISAAPIVFGNNVDNLYWRTDQTGDFSNIGPYSDMLRSTPPMSLNTEQFKATNNVAALPIDSDARKDIDVVDRSPLMSPGRAKTHALCSDSRDSSCTEPVDDSLCEMNQLQTSRKRKSLEKTIVQSDFSISNETVDAPTSEPIVYTGNIEKSHRKAMKNIPSLWEFYTAEDAVKFSLPKDSMNHLVSESSPDHQKQTEE